MSTGSVWSKEEEKAFENAIAMHWIDEDCKEQWEKIASMVPNKNLEELRQHYQLLVDDVNAIEAGHIPVPNYVGEETSSLNKDSHGPLGSATSDKRLNCGHGGGFSGLGQDPSGHGGKGGSRSDQERRKGIPWTEEEHRYSIYIWTFLLSVSIFIFWWIFYLCVCVYLFGFKRSTEISK